MNLGERLSAALSQVDDDAAMPSDGAPAREAAPAGGGLLIDGDVIEL